MKMKMTMMLLTAEWGRERKVTRRAERPKSRGGRSWQRALTLRRVCVEHPQAHSTPVSQQPVVSNQGQLTSHYMHASLKITTWHTHLFQVKAAVMPHQSPTTLETLYTFLQPLPPHLPHPPSHPGCHTHEGPHTHSHLASTSSLLLLSWVPHKHRW